MKRKEGNNNKNLTKSKIKLLNFKNCCKDPMILMIYSLLL